MEQYTDPIDLYVGTMADFALEPESVAGAWQRMQGASAEQLREATAGSFAVADPMDRNAWEAILAHFPSAKESLLEHSFVLSRRGQAVGACLVSRRRYLTPNRAVPYIDLVAVRPSEQNQGLAVALLQRVGRSLWEAGYRDLIHAHIRRGNAPSERLFRRLGFLLWQQDCERAPTRPRAHNKTHRR